jgi:hypothetical protein
MRAVETLCRKEEFSVIIIGLDGAGKTVNAYMLEMKVYLNSPGRRSWRR